MDGTGSEGGFAALKSNADTKSLPKSVMVYRVKFANVTKPQVETLARKLRLTGQVEDVGGKLQVVDTEANFEVDKATGSFDYTTKAFEEQTEPILGVLSDAEYRTKAEAFLADSGLMESDAEFRDINRGNIVGTWDGKAWVERPYMVEVRFSHKSLNGVAFDQGVGPKLIVQFGDNARILGAMSVWRDIEPLSSYSIKSPDEALAAAANGQAQLYDVGQADSGVVDDISLSYMNSPLGYDQKYVVPMYIMKGVGRSGGRFIAIANAIPDAMLQVDASLVHPVSVPASAGKK
jgi:hypothetical protein